MILLSMSKIFYSKCNAEQTVIFHDNIFSITSQNIWEQCSSVAKKLGIFNFAFPLHFSKAWVTNLIIKVVQFKIVSFSILHIQLEKLYG